MDFNEAVLLTLLQLSEYIFLLETYVVICIVKKRAALSHLEERVCLNIIGIVAALPKVRYAKAGHFELGLVLRDITVAFRHFSLKVYNL